MERYNEIVEFFQQHPEAVLDDVDLHPWEHIRDGKEFTESHIELLKSANPLWRWQVYYDRLLKYYLICKAMWEI